LILAADGSFTYTPDQDFFGSDSFSYHLSDPNGGGSALYTINVQTDQLIALDRTTGAQTVVGTVAHDFHFVDLAYLDGVLYALDANGSDIFVNPGWNLVGIDPRTGTKLSEVTVTASGSAPLLIADGLEAFNGGLVLLYDTADLTPTMIGTLNINTGVATLLYDYEVVAGGINFDIDGLGASAAGVLYGVDTEGSFEKQVLFREIDIVPPPSITNIRDYTLVNTIVDDLAFTPYGIFAVDRGLGRLQRIDPITYQPVQSFALGAGSNNLFGVAWAPANESIATVTITVNAVNDEPSYTVTGNPPAINEDAGVQTISGFITSFSSGPANESTQQVLEYVVSNVSDNTFFSEGPSVSTSGTLTYKVAANTSGSVSFDLAVRDTGGTDNNGDNTSATQRFTITVNPINDAPTFTASTPPSINEDAGTQIVDDFITSFSGGSGETNQQVVEYLVSNISDAAFFATPPSVSNDGKLTYKVADHVFGTVTFDLAVRDNGGSANNGDDTSGAQTVTITVNAVNDAPSFTAANLPTIDEDADAQTVTGFVTSFTPGPTNEAAQQALEYVVSNVSNTAFFSDLPSVSANGTLTYKVADNVSGSVTFDLAVRDNGGTDRDGVDTSTTKTITITVNPVNDTPTNLTFTGTTITENSPLGTVVGTLAATDIDANETLTFSLVDDSGSHNHLFKVVGNSLQTNGLIDFETNPVLNIRVAVTDQAGGSIAATFQITVVNTADVASVSGRVYFDGLNDVGLAGRTVFVDGNANGAFDVGEASVLTGANGTYALTLAVPGAYTLRTVLLPGDVTTTPAIVLDLTTEENRTGQDFGIRYQSVILGSTATADVFTTVVVSPNVGYIQSLYRALLGREAEEAGLSNWVARLQEVGDRNQVATEIWNSVEHRASQVDSYYRIFLGREADAAGRANWVQQFFNGASEEEIIQGFLTSVEYASLYPDTASFVEASYRQLLGEVVSAGNLANEISQLNNGLSRVDFVRSLLFSTESLTRSITGIYSALLQRESDASGAGSALNNLRQGMSMGNLAIGVLASDEFFMRAGGLLS